MAYTIIEVERMTGIPSRTLRFWLDKGLFPFIERDRNGVRYFAQSDVDWALWINCLRWCDMSIGDIKHYIALSQLGFESARERRAMLEKQSKLVSAHIARLGEIEQKLIAKIARYDEMIQSGVDTLNPSSSSYQTPDTKKAMKANAQSMRKDTQKGA